MSLLRRVLLPGLLTAIAALASGCLVQSVTVRQSVGGPVEVEVQVCQMDDHSAGGDPITLECDPSISDPSTVPAVLDTGGAQFFLGFLVPTGVTARDATMSGGLTSPLTEFQPLVDHLTAMEPPPAGRTWIGFRSGPLQDGTSNTARLIARFDAPGLGGQEFAYRARILVRGATTEAEAENPDLSGLLPIDVPTIAGTSLTGTFAVRDVTLAAGQAAPVDVRGGQTATVPFVADYRGATPSGLLPVSATTSIPGATAAPTATPLHFASTATAPLAAQVAVPPNAPVGVHAVTLRLPLADGGERTATAQLRVLADPPPAPAPPPQVVIQSRTQRFTAAQIRDFLAVVAVRTTKRGAVLSGGLRFEQTLPAAGRVVWELRTRSGTALARLARTVTAPGKQTVTLKLSRAGRRAARRGRSTRVALKTTFTPTGQAAVPVTKNLTLGR